MKDRTETETGATGIKRGREKWGSRNFQSKSMSGQNMKAEKLPYWQEESLNLSFINIVSNVDETHCFRFKST